MENILRKNNIMVHEKERKIKAIMREDSNHICIDCNKGKSDYISLNNACFICKTCFKFHQKFPVSISKTIKNNLNSLNLKELQYLYFGGNKKLLEFMKYEYPKLIKLSPTIAYKTIAMEYYRHWLKYLIEGGNKPHKPDMEIAYKSIDDKDFINKNFLNVNNNEGNVITIDFFNDCYNYNDKYNHTIINYINKKNNNKYKNDYNTNRNTNPYINNYINKKDLADYYTGINNNKYINTQTIDFFSNTQTNFMPKKNNFGDNFNNQNKQTYRKKSTEDIIMDSNRKTSVLNNINNINNINNLNILNNTNQKTKMNYNNNDNYNDKTIRPFKTNKNIYVKPKHGVLKSLEKSPMVVQKNKAVYQEKDNNNNNEKEIKNDNNMERNNNKDAIKVKIIKNIKGSKDMKRVQSNSELKSQKTNEKNKINNSKNFKSDNIISDDTKEDINNNGYLKDNKKITQDNYKIKINKKMPKCDSTILTERKGKTESQEKEMKQMIDSKSNANININTIIKDNDNTVNNNNNIVFKKKSLNDNFSVDLDKNSKMNYSTTQSHFEIIHKNKMNATNDEIIRNYDNTDDSLSLTVRTLSTNKSMKQFYSRHPRKMNRTLTKKRKFNENNRKERKEEKEKNKTEKKMKKLKKEKTEILQSLKILLKMKNELSKKEENQNDDEEEEEENEDEKEKSDEENNDKSNNKDNEDNRKNKKDNKKININVLTKKEIAKNKNIVEVNNEGENDDEEEEEKQNKYKKKLKKERKKIHVTQSQDFIIKREGEDSIRTKYKKKQFKYSEI